MQTILYLIRHGETDWNRQRRIQGHSDIPLNESGTEQARLLAKRYKHATLAAIYASDLQRARDTAAPLAEALGLPVQALTDLRERCYGTWEGLTYEEIRARFADPDPDDTIYGIETLEALKERASRCLEGLALKHPEQVIAVVSHGGFINAFLHKITNGQMGTGITRIDNTGVTVVRYGRHAWEIAAVNDTSHLD